MTDARDSGRREPIREERVAGALAHRSIAQAAPVLRSHGFVPVQFAVPPSAPQGPPRARRVAAAHSNRGTSPRIWVFVTHHFRARTLGGGRPPVRTLHTAPA